MTVYLNVFDGFCLILLATHRKVPWAVSLFSLVVRMLHPSDANEPRVLCEASPMIVAQNCSL
jgi:hypothetical protein